MKKFLLLAALLAALCGQSFAQAGVATYIHYGTSLPSGAPQWSIFSKIDGSGIFQCTNSPTCTSAGQWTTIGSAGSGTLTGVVTGAASGLTGGGLSGTLTMSLLTSCAPNQVLQWISSAWTCSSAGSGTVTGSGLTLNQLVFGGGSAAIAVGDLTGDTTTAGGKATTVKGINGVLLSGLTTGILKNTTATGVPSIATGTDVASLLSASAPITMSGAGAFACATCGVTGSPLSQFAATTSAQLSGVISDEIGSGKAVFATALQGTDANLMTAGTVSGTSASLCTDANGGATTVSCPSGGPALGTAAQVPVMNAGATAYVAVTVSGDSTLGSTGVMANTKINGVAFSGLATGILKNTTATGVPSIATGTDVASLLSASAPITMSGAGAFACATCGVTGSPLSQFAATTSAQLAGVLSDEIGSGKAVFATALQGTDANVMTAGTVSGTSAALCTDANGGATTVSCPAGGSGLSGMTAGQIAIAATASTITSSKAIQGTDTSILSSGTISGTSAALCTDANGGATTVSCPSGGSGLSGMTAGQVAIAATASTITSSEALAGAGAGITTGPISGTTAGHVVTEQGTTGQVQDSGTALSALAPLASPTFTGTVSGIAPASSFFIGSNGSSQLIAAQPFVVNAQIATYPVVAADFAGCKTITVASGTFTVTLVASGSQPASGQCINVVNYGSGVVTIARSGQNINGAAANFTLNAGSASAPTSATVTSDGTNYFATVDEATTGTVTSLATTSPITGGTITGSGTIACATCGVMGSPLSQFAATTSAQLAGVLSDEIGSGKAVFATALQGALDANVLMAGTVSGTAAALCTDANGGATTSGCPSGGPALGTAAQVPVMNAGATAYAPVTVSGDTSITSLGVTTVNKLQSNTLTLTTPAQSQVTTFNASGVLVNAYSGVNVDAQTTDYTFGCPTDRLGEIEFNITSAKGFYLPQAGSTACTQSSMAMVVRNASISTAQLTLCSGTGTSGSCTPGTSTFQPEAVASMNLIPGAAAFIYSDAVSGTGNYHAIPIATPPGGTNVQTASYLITALDKDKFIVMNCASACVATLPAAPPTAKFNIGILSIGATLATVSLNSLNFNGAGTAPTLTTGHAIFVRSDGTNYFGDISAASGGGGNLNNSGTPTVNQVGLFVDATHLAGSNYLSAGIKGGLDSRSDAGTYALSGGTPNAFGRLQDLSTASTILDATNDQTATFWATGAVNIDPLNPGSKNTIIFGSGNGTLGSGYCTDVSQTLGQYDVWIGNATTLIGGACGTTINNGTTFNASSVFPGNTFQVYCTGGTCSHQYAALKSGAAGSASIPTLIGPGWRFQVAGEVSPSGVPLPFHRVLPCQGQAAPCYLAANVPSGTCVGALCYSSFYSMGNSATIADSGLITSGFTFVPAINSVACSSGTPCTLTFLAPIIGIGDATALNTATQGGSPACGACNNSLTGAQVKSISVSGGSASGACIGGENLLGQENSYFQDYYVTNCGIGFLLEGQGSGQASPDNSGDDRNLNVAIGPTFANLYGTTAPVTLVELDGGYYDLHRMTINGTNLGSAANVTSFTGTSGTLTFTNTGNNNFTAGATAYPNGFTGGNTGLNGQTITILAAGLSATTFEAAVTGSGYASGAGTVGSGAAQFAYGVVHITNAPGTNYGNGGRIHIYDFHIEGCDYNTCGGGTIATGTQDCIYLDTQSGGGYPGSTTGDIDISDFNTSSGTHSCVNAIHVNANFTGTLNLHAISCGTGNTNIIKDDINGNVMTCANNTPGAGFYYLDGAGAAFTNFNCADITKGWCSYNGKWQYYAAGVTTVNLASGGSTFGTPTGGQKGTGTINATGLFVNGAAVGTGSGSVSSIATTAPITGGTITTTGTIACATCVTSSAPGLGIAHFAGSTQAVTSSLIAIADLSATGTPSSTTFLRGDNTWSTPAGGGTVTTFSAGTLSPLFTTSVATATTTPALSFALSNAAAGTFLGNNTSAAAGPAYVTLSANNPQTATYQVLASDFTAYKTITVASGTFTITLVPSTSQPTAGQYINVINYGSGVVTVARSGQNINGAAASLILTAGSAAAPTSALIESDGTNYFSAVDQAGTVSSVGTSAPLGGGPIVGTGTITCATCVTSSSPGVGIAHFAGSTQAVTSSLIVAADITANTITGSQLAASLALVTPLLGTPTSGVLTNETGYLWNNNAAPTGNLAIAMGADTSIFTTTTAEAQMFAWKNNTAAVVGTSQGSPIPAVCGTAFHGSASVESCATWGVLPGNGNDAQIVVTHGVTGTSTGAVVDTFAGALAVGSSPPNNAAGTAGGAVYNEGTGFTPVALTDGLYANSTNHCLDIVNQTVDVGCGIAVASAQTMTGAKTFTGGIVNTTTPVRDQTRFVLVSSMTAVSTAGVNVGSTGASNATFSWPVTAANWYDMECTLPVTFVSSATIKWELVSISGSVTVSNVVGTARGNTAASAAFQSLDVTAGTTLATSVTPISGAPGGVSEMVTLGYQFLTSHAGNIGLEFLGNATNNVQLLLGGQCGLTQIN